jgi:hypothetical protein
MMLVGVFSWAKADEKLKKRLASSEILFIVKNWNRLQNNN